MTFNNAAGIDVALRQATGVTQAQCTTWVTSGPPFSISNYPANAPLPIVYSQAGTLEPYAAPGPKAGGLVGNWTAPEILPHENLIYNLITYTYRI